MGSLSYLQNFLVRYLLTYTLGYLLGMRFIIWKSNDNPAMDIYFRKLLLYYKSLLLFLLQKPTNCEKVFIFKIFDRPMCYHKHEYHFHIIIFQHEIPAICLEFAIVSVFILRFFFVLFLAFTVNWSLLRQLTIDKVRGRSEKTSSISWDFWPPLLCYNFYKITFIK